MKKLVYIDAENLAHELIIESVNKIKSHLKESDLLIGKIYGGRDQVKRSVPYCLLNGYTYVETSLYSTAKKNVADMKILIDCMLDAATASIKKEKVEVILLTSDSDFLPLVYKLRELNIHVVTPFYDLESMSNTDKTTADLDSFLKKIGFYAPKDSCMLGNMFDAIKELAGEVYSDDLIEDHIRIKTTKFRNFLNENFSTLAEIDSNERTGAFADFANPKTDEMKPRDFSFFNAIKNYNISGKETLNYVYTIYVSKVFGYIPKNKIIPAKELANVLKLN